MARLVQIIAMGMLCTGCGFIQWTTLSAPAPHPLLNTADWRRSIRKTAGTQTPSSNPSHLFGVIRRNIQGLNHNAYRTQHDELKLLRAIYRGTSIEKQLRRVRSVKGIKSLGRRIRKPSRIGDVLFFDKSEVGPQVAIVTGRAPDGTFKAHAIHLGRAKTIKVHPARRAQRRYRGKIINSIIRQVRPGDTKRRRYLAGDALYQVRRLHN